MKLRYYATVGMMLTSLVAAPALAEDTANTTATTTPPVRKTLDLACMQSAVEKRDNAIIAAFDAYSASVKTALTTRRDALKAAWGLTDRIQRRDAINAAWKAHRKARNDAFRTLRDARRAAWKQFRADAKTCKATGTSGTATEFSGEGVDATL